MGLEELEDYVVTHTGEGRFQVTIEDNETIEAGPNLCGMINFTYFEDGSYPEIGWVITRKELYSYYIPKLMSRMI